MFMMQSLKNFFITVSKFLKTNFKLWTLFLTVSCTFLIGWLYFNFYTPQNIPDVSRIPSILDNIQILNNVARDSDFVRYLHFNEYGIVTKVKTKELVTFLNSISVEDAQRLGIKDDEFGVIEYEIDKLTEIVNSNYQIKKSFLIKAGLILSSFSVLFIMSLIIKNTEF